MFAVEFTRPGYSFGFRWCFSTLTEAQASAEELTAQGYTVRIVSMKSQPLIGV